MLVDIVDECKAGAMNVASLLCRYAWWRLRKRRPWKKSEQVARSRSWRILYSRTTQSDSMLRCRKRIATRRGDERRDAADAGQIILAAIEERPQALYSSLHDIIHFRDSLSLEASLNTATELVTREGLVCRATIVVFNFRTSRELPRFVGLPSRII